MKIHRFIGDFDLSRKEIIVHDIELVHQMNTVLKLARGEAVVISDGHGKEAHATITTADKKSVTLAVSGVDSISREPRRHVIAYVAIIKRELFDLVVQKLTEIGVAEIIPIITRRTVKLAIKESRLQTIIREAAEQSGRTMLPMLHEPMEFKKALTHAAPNQDNFFFDGSGTPRFVVSHATAPVGIFIGPEGGWDETEVQLAKDAGCIMVSLGLLTLRAETAAIVASYLLAAG